MALNCTECPFLSHSTLQYLCFAFSSPFPLFLLTFGYFSFPPPSPSFSVPSASPSVTQLQELSRSIFLSWEELAAHERNGIITSYTISIMNLDDPEGVAESFNVTGLSLTISDLTPYTTYGLLLAASTIIGSGPSSDLHAVQTHEEGKHIAS